MAKLIPHVDVLKEEASRWILWVDGTSNLKGYGARIILEGLDGVMIEQLLHFSFETSNNQP